MSEVNLLEDGPVQDNQNAISTAKPEGLPDKFWDEQAGQVRVDDLIKSYCALEKKLSGGMSVPEDEEGRARLMRMMGVPETPDAYVISMKNDMLAPDADLNARLHAKNFTSEQVQEVYDLAAERLVPLILDIAAEYQADREVQRLIDKFGGAEQWQEISRQLLTYGRKNLSPAVLTGLASSYDGVMALYKLMNGEAADGQMLEEGQAPEQLSEEALHAMMREPKYWRERDPALMAKVSQGFKRLYDK